MKPFIPLILLAVPFLAACGGSEAEVTNQADPLNEVPTAEQAAAEADSINADNADQALADLEKDLEADQ